MRKLKNRGALQVFGGFIRAGRNAKGMTQQEVADEVGMHQTYYCMIENADREVDLVTAIKICKVLELDLSDYIKTQIKNNPDL